MHAKSHSAVMGRTPDCSGCQYLHLCLGRKICLRSSIAAGGWIVKKMVRSTLLSDSAASGMHDRTLDLSDKISPCCLLCCSGSRTHGHCLQLESMSRYRSRRHVVHAHVNRRTHGIQGSAGLTYECKRKWSSGSAERPSIPTPHH